MNTAVRAAQESRASAEIELSRLTEIRVDTERRAAQEADARQSRSKCSPAGRGALNAEHEAQRAAQATVRAEQELQAAALAREEANHVPKRRPRTE